MIPDTSLLYFIIVDYRVEIVYDDVINYKAHTFYKVIDIGSRVNMSMIIPAMRHIHADGDNSNTNAIAGAGAS